MHRYIHHQALVGPAGQHWDKDQVAAGTDRQEFGYTLNNCQDEKMQCRHGPVPPQENIALPL